MERDQNPKIVRCNMSDLLQTSDYYKDMNPKDALNFVRPFIISAKEVMLGQIKRRTLRDKIIVIVNDSHLSIKDMTYNETIAYLADESWKQFASKIPRY